MWSENEESDSQGTHTLNENTASTNCKRKFSLNKLSMKIWPQYIGTGTGNENTASAAHVVGE
jgi:hypothetical protein